MAAAAAAGDKTVSDGTGALSGAPAAGGRRAQRRLERETAIVQAARELMAVQGYEAMTMDDLAAQAGISKPTLYQHFPSKESIAIRTATDLIRQMREYVVGLDGALPADRRLEMVVRHMVMERFSKNKLSMGPAAKAALVPVIRTNPDYRREFEGLVAAIGAIVDRAKADGTVETAIATRVAVQAVFSVIRDSEYEELLARRETTVGEIADTVTSVLLGGMRRRRADGKNP